MSERVREVLETLTPAARTDAPLQLLGLRLLGSSRVSDVGGSWTDAVIYHQPSPSPSPSSSPEVSITSIAAHTSRVLQLRCSDGSRSAIWLILPPRLRK